MTIDELLKKVHKKPTKLFRYEVKNIFDCGDEFNHWSVNEIILRKKCIENNISYTKVAGSSDEFIFSVKDYSLFNSPGTRYTVTCVRDNGKYMYFGISENTACLYGVKPQNILNVEVEIIQTFKEEYKVPDDLTGYMLGFIDYGSETVRYIRAGLHMFLLDAHTSSIESLNSDYRGISALIKIHEK